MSVAAVVGPDVTKDRPSSFRGDEMGITAVSNAVLSCLFQSNTSIVQHTWSKFIWNNNYPTFIGARDVDIYLFNAQSETPVANWTSISNNRGMIGIYAGDDWFPPIKTWQNGPNISYPYFFVITNADAPLTGGEQHQATFTAVQTAPQAAFVSASVASASLSSLTSLALPSSSPTSLQNGSSDDSFPKWEIALIAAAIECANYNANNLQPSISPSMNTPTSRLLSASGMSNNKRERLGFVNRHLRNTRTFLSSSGGSGSATDCNNSLASANTVTTTKGFNHVPNSPHGSILATSFTYDKSFGQEGQTLVGGQELELLGQGLKTHIEMTKSLVESLSFSYSSSQLSRITAGSNPKLSPSEFSHNSSPSGNNSTTSS
ncbi:hypothetical protein BY996DRAFT_8487065 [Phakopsora pachyrhizi]|nr:hypothetical protein BY996DRAFT_8487065 [Phakopsora pachyrhizi]